MYAVVGQVKIKPSQEDLTLSMIRDRGVAMFRGMEGAQHAYWCRTFEREELIQHSFWVFDTEANARTAQATFSTLRDMPDAPAVFVSVDIAQIVGEA